MPQLKVDHVVSFGSEDPAHPANNILDADPLKKWKCKETGEKSATVVLQLEKASSITGIDIGNENSAYIEVLVSRSGSNDDFKVLLVMSSFMTPLEARQTQNINKVRMFKYEDLADPQRDQKWDRIKVVCTQPFNRHVQYGLSFISFHSNEDNGGKNTQKLTFGKFALRPESPKDELAVGSLFAKRKEIHAENEPLKGAAAIRAASTTESLSQYGSPKCKPKKFKNMDSPSTSKVEEYTSSRNDKNKLLYADDEIEKNEKNNKIDSKIEKKAKEKEKALDKEKTDSPKLKNTENKEKQEDKRNSIKRKRSNERSDKKNKKEKLTKPFNRLLEGVTIVISGIQNPDRANLRSMALEMGAKYKPDWENTCTHLICAFANTPKFNQVKGKGKIVTKKWIQDCHSERKRLPWRRYALDKNDKGPESEEEIFEDIPKEKTPERVQSDISDDLSADGSDTEERVKKIMEKQKNNGKKDVSIYEKDTDSENEKNNSHNGLDIKKKLPDFFEGKVFHVDTTFDRDLQKKLNQYITAYKGTTTDDPIDKIDIIVSTNENAENFKEVNETATCVTPDWIWECHNCQKLTDINEFII